MKHKGLKVLVALSSLTLTVGLAACGGMEEEFLVPTEGVTYKISYDGTYATVTGYTGTITEVVIASVYKGVPVTRIGSEAFGDSDDLTSVVIGNSVTSIGDGAFYNCDSLTEIVISDSVTSIGFYAFCECSSLTEIVIPDSVTSIGEGAFSNCSSLTEIVIPDSVTSIGDGAFYDCDNLQYTTKGGLKYLGNSNNPYVCLVNTETWDITTATIESRCKIIADGAFAGCDNLRDIEVSENNTKYESIDGNLYSKDGKTLIQYAIGKTATSFTIPDSVTSIGGSAFAYCDSLTEIIIPDSVTSIGDGAFYDCDSLQYTTKGGLEYLGNSNNPYVCLVNTETWDITTATIENSCKIIANGAFAWCDSLTEIVIPDSVTNIGSFAFADCDSLTSVVIGNSVTSIRDWAFVDCDSLTSVVIGNSVTFIGEDAFYNCDSLTEIVIPDSVTNIDLVAFAYCDSLWEITFNGTMEQWNNVTKGDRWNFCVPATKVICVDGKVAL